MLKYFAMKTISYNSIIFWVFLTGFCINSYAETAETISIHSLQKACGFNGIDYAQSVKFVTQLKLALVNDNKLMMAKMGDYPIRLNYNNQSKISYAAIRNQQEFIKLYDKIFTIKMKNKILHSNSQNVFCNYKGAMIANGIIWFRTNTTQTRFFAINQGE
jgi:hypothetical protein